MGILIAGADDRFLYLKDMLWEMGLDVKMDEGGDYEAADTLIAKYPFSENVKEGLKTLKDGATLILLNACAVEDEIKSRFQVYPLSEDAFFVNENAVLTAEGAVFMAMKNAAHALTGERAMVIGYGRIGRALTEMLVGLRSVVTVVSRRESGRLQAMARGAYAVSPDSIKPLLADEKMIFVTSPDRILDADELSYIPKSAYICDLSSAPYGVNHEKAKNMGLNAMLESGLPGRYCPLSAARSMYRAVLRIVNGGKE
ncbi:MAG: hypothetical protein IJD86_02500 [Clostridia bacterium]|nr:hypothetical protein [Clostridia bacterium]